MTESDHHKYHIAIVGGGTAGWMAAAAFSRALSNSHYKITLIESADIPTIGVGEATIPPIQAFNDLLGVDENQMLAATNGTYKLGIEFINWCNIGDSYYHPFGTYGPDAFNVQFHQLWQKARQNGNAKTLDMYSLNSEMSKRCFFAKPQNVPNSPLAKINYAFHFDASLWAKFLRELSQKQGVIRIEGNIENCSLDPESGEIKKLHVQNSADIEADFYVDCTGFKGLLIEEALKTGYENWSHFLPCDSAAAVQSQTLNPLPSHTKAIAHGFGWQWRIPLQHRTGNGFVYSNQYCSNELAELTLLQNLASDATTDVRHIKFTTGRRKKAWNKNCLSLGLSSGFLEPLESTSIHLIQSAISKFIGLLPSFSSYQAEQKRFNKQIESEFLSIRDFIILHYKATNRDDTEFWRYCRDMAIPDSLQEKIELYQSTGYLYKEGHELFSENSWLSVFEGQGISCENLSPLTAPVSTDEISKHLDGTQHVIKQCAAKTQAHRDYLNKHCSAPTT